MSSIAFFRRRHITNKTLKQTFRINVSNTIKISHMPFTSVKAVNIIKKT